MNDGNMAEIVSRLHRSENPMLRSVADVMQAFREHGYNYNDAQSDGDFISLLLEQLAEAVQHSSRGETDRYVNEMCDIISIAIQAVAVKGRDPEAALLQRVYTGIIPKVSDGRIFAKYRLKQSAP